MVDVELPTVEIIIGPDGDQMFFIGQYEIDKPKQLAVAVGEIVAFSESGLGGKRYVFTASQVAHVQNMQVADRPCWIGWIGAKFFRMNAECEPKMAGNWFDGFQQGSVFEAESLEVAQDWLNKQCRLSGTDNDLYYMDYGPTAVDVD